MHPRSRIIQLTCLLLISISGFLLGTSQGSLQITVTAIAGGIAGFLLVDYWRLFHLSGWLANAASILILLFALQDFYGGDSAVKLTSVGRLLIYLQTVLLFQQKTPRLYWQVLVLTLLQVVVAAIFNLNFEGGVLFIVYFGIAGAMMMLQCDLTQWFDVERANTRNLGEARDRAVAVRGGKQITSEVGPLMVFEQQVPISYWQLIKHLFPWLVVAFAFAVVLFYNVPRNENAWLGPGFKKVIGTGMSYEIDLAQTGQIPQSGKLMFRAWFKDPSGKQVQLTERPYFRGLPLSRLVINDNVTDWVAPHDSVYSWSYVELPRNNTKFDNWLIQEFAVEGTNDPLLFATVPYFGTRSTPKEVEYCLDISALSRRRRGDHAELQVYNYEMGVKVSREMEPLRSWPFYPEATASRYETLMDNVGLYESLIDVDPSRYPELVNEAEQLAARYASTGTLNLAQIMSASFSELNGFSYTLDFTQFDFDESLDPLEDFFRNHRSGHCQFFASALAVMLRSQKIPCRVVTGFYGGEFNTVSNCYMVREKHAHAWVEVYIPPSQCTKEMIESGAAGRGGAWAILDPTENVFNEETMLVNGQPLELARNLWQDYILGLDRDNQPEPITISSSRILGLFDLSNWQRIGESTVQGVQTRPVIAGVLVVAAFGMFGLILYRRLKQQTRIVRRKSTKPVSRLRRFVGEALAWISPDLGTWVMGDVYQQQIVPFYEKMVKLLQRHHQLERQPTQTHREFAEMVGQHFQSHADVERIQIAVEQITDAFYYVRFGNRRLSQQEQTRIESEFEFLETQLKLSTTSAS